MQPAAELSFLTLGVLDPARARRFLEHALGFEPLPSRSGLVLFRSGSLTLALHPRADLARESGWPPPTPPWAATPPAPSSPQASATSPGEPGAIEAGAAFPGLLLSINLPDRASVEGCFARCLAAGATPLSPPAERPWGGFVAILRDPEGFPWELCHNPRRPSAP